MQINPDDLQLLQDSIDEVISEAVGNYPYIYEGSPKDQEHLSAHFYKAVSSNIESIAAPFASRIHSQGECE